MKQFYLPTRIVTGSGCFAELGAQSLADAASLIGKTVTGAGISGSPVTGVAEAALLREGQVYLRVSGAELPLSGLREVVLHG